MHFLLILNVVLHLLGLCEGLRTVNGLINSSVTLSSGSQHTSPTVVRWTIKNIHTATYYARSDFIQTNKERFGERLHLNKEDGSLQIKQVQKADEDIYDVEVTHNDGKHTDKVKLVIYEKADTPILEVLYNASGPGFCNVSVRCAAHNGLCVASLCEFARGELECWDTARNDSAHSASLCITATNDTSVSLCITATNDAINCSSSNPASTSSAPLLPVTHICHIDVPGPKDPAQRSRKMYSILVIVCCSALVGIALIYRYCKLKTDLNKTDRNDMQQGEPKTDLNDLQQGEPKTDPIISNQENPKQILIISNQENPKQISMISNKENPNQILIISNQENPKQILIISNQKNPKQILILSNQENPKQILIISNQENPKQISMISNKENPKQTRIISNLENPPKASLILRKIKTEQSLMI